MGLTYAHIHSSNQFCWSSLIASAWLQHDIISIKCIFSIKEIVNTFVQFIHDCTHETTFQDYWCEPTLILYDMKDFIAKSNLMNINSSKKKKEHQKSLISRQDARLLSLHFAAGFVTDPRKQLNGQHHFSSHFWEGSELLLKSRVTNIVTHWNAGWSP